MQETSAPPHPVLSPSFRSKRSTHWVQTLRNREEAELEVFGTVEEALHVFLPVLRIRLVERDGVEIERLPVGQDCVANVPVSWKSSSRVGRRGRMAHLEAFCTPP